MLIIAKFVAVLVFVIGVVATFYQAAPSDQLSFFGNSFPAAAFAATTILLIAGIVFGCLFRQISGRAASSRINIVKEVQDVFASPSFWTALCVSPFVLFGVYAVVSAAPGDPASFLLAFQNGFFCESVFRQLTAGIGQRKDGATGQQQTEATGQQQVNSTQEPPQVGLTAG
jgi:hypothetical protein